MDIYAYDFLIFAANPNSKTDLFCSDWRLISKDKRTESDLLGFLNFYSLNQN